MALKRSSRPPLNRTNRTSGPLRTIWSRLVSELSAICVNRVSIFSLCVEKEFSYAGNRSWATEKIASRCTNGFHHVHSILSQRSDLKLDRLANILWNYRPFEPARDKGLHRRRWYFEPCPLTKSCGNPPLSMISPA